MFIEKNTDTCLGIVLDEEEVKIAIEKDRESGEGAFRRVATRMVLDVFEDVRPKNGYAAARFQDQFVAITFGAGVIGSYSGSETRGESVTNAGKISLDVEGDNVDYDLLESKCRTYWERQLQDV